MFITKGPYWTTGSRMGLTAQDEDFECMPVRILTGIGGNADPVTGAEHGQLSLRGSGDPTGPTAPAARQHVDECVEVAVPRDVQPRAGLDRAVRHRYRRVGSTRALVSGDVARDQTHQRSTVVGGQQSDLAALDGLIPRRRELVLTRQVHPQLDAVEHPATFDQFGGRSLDVQDS